LSEILPQYFPGVGRIVHESHVRSAKNRSAKVRSARKRLAFQQFYSILHRIQE
jgi:hypothetical protein